MVKRIKDCISIKFKQIVIILHMRIKILKQKKKIKQMINSYLTFPRDVSHEMYV